MREERATVHLIDDDRRVLKAIARLLESHGWRVRSYQSPEAFLSDHDQTVPGCLIVDLLMPEMTGLDLQRELIRLGEHRPIIFLSGRGDVPSSVSAMKAGAVDFLTKPIDDDVLLAAVATAMERDARDREAADRRRSAHERLSSLTLREREVLDGVVAGLLNKQIAGQLGIVEKTVKVHRARAVAKLGVRTTADLVRMVQAAVGEPTQRQAPAQPAAASPPG
jgi:FixJ family two-component response regulator